MEPDAGAASVLLLLAFWLPLLLPSVVVVSIAFFRKDASSRSNLVSVGLLILALTHLGLSWAGFWRLPFGLIPAVWIAVTIYVIAASAYLVVPSPRDDRD